MRPATFKVTSGVFIALLIYIVILHLRNNNLKEIIAASEIKKIED